MIPELEAIKESPRMSHVLTVWHSHPTLQIGYLSEGRLIMEFSEGSFSIAPGTFTLIAAGHLHRIEAKTGTTQFVGHVRLSGRPRFFSRQAAASAGFAWLRDRTYLIPHAERLGAWLREIACAWENGGSTGRAVSQGLLLRLLAALPEWEGTRIERRSVRQASSGERARFEQAIRVIEQRYTDPSVQTPEIAAACGMSLSALYKLFAREAGCGPKRFLRQYRVERAREMMTPDGEPLGRIAERTGFPDLYTFSRVYRRETGEAPSAYRKRVAMWTRTKS